MRPMEVACLQAAGVRTQGCVQQGRRVKARQTTPSGTHGHMCPKRMGRGGGRGAFSGRLDRGEGSKGGTHVVSSVVASTAGLARGSGRFSDPNFTRGALCLVDTTAREATEPCCTHSTHTNHTNVTEGVGEAAGGVGDGRGGGGGWCAMGDVRRAAITEQTQEPSTYVGRHKLCAGGQEALLGHGHPEDTYMHTRTSASKQGTTRDCSGNNSHLANTHMRARTRTRTHAHTPLGENAFNSATLSLSRTHARTWLSWKRRTAGTSFVGTRPCCPAR
jgi:hypothetical protein